MNSRPIARTRLIAAALVFALGFAAGFSWFALRRGHAVCAEMEQTSSAKM